MPLLWRNNSYSDIKVHCVDYKTANKDTQSTTILNSLIGDFMWHKCQTTKPTPSFLCVHSFACVYLLPFSKELMLLVSRFGLAVRCWARNQAEGRFESVKFGPLLPLQS